MSALVAMFTRAIVYGGVFRLLRWLPWPVTAGLVVLACGVFLVTR